MANNNYCTEIGDHVGLSSEHFDESGEDKGFNVGKTRFGALFL